ncbi:NAD(P)H-dependent oxidoreductase [Microvirga roseola]|uniref:NAD(P)H-dependent oxidoreductase n=1 Tax=Microvirga roseola TaxID=2883126 RepID=UPI001E3A1BF0|nr:NAD(P)H-dependent oxidoreductase [Microvirga roseola]
MPHRIAIIDGHPDSERNHFCHALAQAYREGAEESGHMVRTITLGSMDLPFVRSQQEWEKGDLPESLRESQDAIGWADHLVIIYPLWLGTMPAVLKAFLEQVFRPGFAFRYKPNGMPIKHLKGKSARIVVTMGMPAFIYRLYFRAHSLKSLKRSILSFVGIGPVRTSLIGSVASPDEAKHRKWLDAMRAYGRKGQ